MDEAQVSPDESCALVRQAGALRFARDDGSGGLTCREVGRVTPPRLLSEYTTFLSYVQGGGTGAVKAPRDGGVPWQRLLFPHPVYHSCTIRDVSSTISFIDEEDGEGEHP